MLLRRCLPPKEFLDLTLFLSLVHSPQLEYTCV
jgi:hypothetical protein